MVVAVVVVIIPVGGSGLSFGGGSSGKSAEDNAAVRADVKDEYTGPMGSVFESPRARVKVSNPTFEEGTDESGGSLLKVCVDVEMAAVGPDDIFNAKNQLDIESSNFPSEKIMSLKATGEWPNGPGAPDLPKGEEYKGS